MKLRDSVILLIVIVLFGKVVAYCAELLIAIKFGASRVTDAFVLARAVPLRIESILSWSFYSAFVPYCVKSLKDGNRTSGSLLISFSRNAILISLAACLFVLLGSDRIVQVFAPGFDRETHALSSGLLKIMSLCIVFGSLAATFQSANASRGHRLIAATGNPVSNVAVVLSLIISTYLFGIYAVAIGLLAGGLCKVAVQCVSFNPFRELSTHWRNGLSKTRTAGIWRSFFLIVGVLLVHETVMVVLRLAASKYEGAMSILNYGYVIVQAPLLVVESLIFYVLYPVFVERSISPDKEEFKDTISKFVRFIVFVLTPVSFLMIVQSGLISRVLLMHGKFSWATADSAAQAIACFSVGLVAFAVDSVAFRVAIILRRMKVYSLILVSRLALNAVLNYVFMRSLDPVTALSLAFSVSLVVAGMFLIFFIGDAIRYRFGSAFCVYMRTVILISCVAGLTAYFIQRTSVSLALLTGFVPRLIVLSCGSAAGIGVYLFLAHRLKIGEVYRLGRMFSGDLKPRILDL